MQRSPPAADNSGMPVAASCPAAHALLLARLLGRNTPGGPCETPPPEQGPAVAEAVAALTRLAEHEHEATEDLEQLWSAELAHAFTAVGHALQAVALAERDAVERHHAAPVRLPVGIEARTITATLAL